MGFSFPGCPLPPGAIIWAYLRDSGGETQDLTSQRAYVLAYCEHYRLHLIRIFEDGATPGGSIEKRDEFELMIELSRLDKKPAVDGIIYWDTKRFARNVLDSQFFKSDLRRRGYKLISLSDNIPDNEFSIVFEAFLEWKAQKDREDIAKDTKRGLRFIIELKDTEGNYLGVAPGKPPACFIGERYDTGLKRNNGKPRIVQRWVPNEELWPKGQRAWEMRAERASNEQIRKETGLYFTAIDPGSVFNAFFKNQIYIGRFCYGGQVYENFVPALISLEVWSRVQELGFKQPKKGQPFPVGKLHPKNGRSEEYLLSGLCSCLFCQSAMHGNRNTRSDRNKFWRFYVCAKKKARPAECEGKQISASRVEEAVLSKLNSTVLTIDFVGQLVEQTNAVLNDTATTEEAIFNSQKRLREIERAIKNLIQTIEIHPSLILIEQLQQREIEQATEKSNLERLQERLKRSIYIDESVAIAVLNDINLSLGGAEIKARQRMLQQMVKKIEIGHNYGRVHCRFPLETLVGFYFMPSTGIELNPINIYEFTF